MSVRRIKQNVLKLLEKSDFEEAKQQLSKLPLKDVVNALFSAICRGEESIHWNGVRCMGYFVARLADEDMEEARIIMRRMLWSLNDESGGIGWGAPEAIAESMVCHEKLAHEYIHMLISYMRGDGEELFQDGNYIEHETLQRGLMWGISRLAAFKPTMLLERGVVDDLIPYLDSGDPVVRGLAVVSLASLKSAGNVGKIKSLADDVSQLDFFQGNRMRTATVSQLVNEALEGSRIEVKQ